MTNHDDNELTDRFNRKLASIEAEIPRPPSLSALGGPGLRRQGGASSPTAVRTRWGALAAVTLVAAVLVGVPLAWRQTQDAGASSSPAPTTAHGTGAPSGAVETPVPTVPPLGPIDRTLDGLDVPGLVHGVPGGADCQVETLSGGLSYGWDLGTVDYVGARGWVFTCPDAVTDRQLYVAIGDAIVAELGRIGAFGGWSHHYAGNPGGTLFDGWSFSGNVFAGDIETVTVRTGLPELTIIVTMNMNGRQPASAGLGSPGTQP
jgi:hypothetical protein